MTFELESLTAAKLLSVNNRSELHGAEPVPAVDLKLSFDSSNDALSLFDGHLKSAIYFNAGVEAEQQDLDGVDPISDMPNLRMPKLGLPLKWDLEGTGYSLRLEYGIGGRSNVQLADCKVNTFTFEPKEGGTVTICLRVQCATDLTEKVLGKLATLVQHDVEITLAPPEPGGQQVGIEEGERVEA